MTEKLETGLTIPVSTHTRTTWSLRNAAMLEYQSTASTDFLAQFRGMTYLQQEKRLMEIGS